MRKFRKRVAAWLFGSSDSFKGIALRRLGRLAFGLLAVYVLVLGSVGGKPLHVDPDRARIVALVSALERYKAVRGDYPRGTQAEIMNALRGATPRWTASSYYPGLYKLYGTFNQSGELVDTWGTPYRTDLDADPKPRVLSAGKNQVFERDAPGSDDICSWR